MKARNKYKLVSSVEPRTDGIVFPDFETARQCDMQKAVAVYDPDTNCLALLDRDGDRVTHKFNTMLKNTSYRPSLIAIPRGEQTNYYFGTEQDEDIPRANTKRRPIVSESNIMEAVNGSVKQQLTVCYGGIEIGKYNPISDEYDLPKELDDVSFSVWEYDHEDDRSFLDVDESELDDKSKLLFDSIARKRKQQTALDNVMSTDPREDFIPESTDAWLHNLYNAVVPSAPTNLIEDTLAYLNKEQSK
ncbi:hypothetical protein [Aeromonas hydrophila]